MRAHRWRPLMQGKRYASTCSLPWPVCASCGLLRLRNAATDAAVRCGCPGDDE